MQYFILLLFSMSFSMGIYLILAHLLKIPTFRARRAVLSMGRQKKRKAGSSDACHHGAGCEAVAICSCWMLIKA
ncbi:MAG: hypothetical protein ACLTQG_30620 [Hungatella sp.]|uniref:hypothetical protein n=1 Tax=Hungatella sp. TaxID=2613924 RepID=UPI003995F7ED